jgi:sugar/nucleoside kinase (ribokinase family)
MAVIEALEEGQARVEGFRAELGKVRHALENTDTALAIAEEGLQVAEDAIEEARRAMPVIITVAVVVTAAAIGVYVWRRREKNHEQQNG